MSRGRQARPHRLASKRRAQDSRRAPRAHEGRNRGARVHYAGHAHQGWDEHFHRHRVFEGTPAEHAYLSLRLALVDSRRGQGPHQLLLQACL